MYYYKLYGMRLASDFELVQLVTLSEQEQKLAPQITILEKPFPKEYKREQDCYSEIKKEQSILSNSYCYLLMEAGERIFYERKEKATDKLLNAYILGWGIAILCYQRGLLAIHCACVEKDGSAILISGDSGSGKSTITGELLKCGYTLMADDITVIATEGKDSVVAAPAFPYQKLCRDALSGEELADEGVLYIDEDKDKFLVPYRGRFCKEALPVKAMYVLGLSVDNAVKVEELVGGDKFRVCMNSLFLKPLLGAQLYAVENGIQVLEFASRIPVYSIKRPVWKDSRDEIRNIILKMQ